MRKIVVTEFVSLDGVMEAPGGGEAFARSGWVFAFPDADQMKFKLDETMGHEAQLLGRRTYEGFLAAWPSRDGVFADRMNGMQKYVVSTTLETADWNNTAILRDLDGVRKLKEGEGGPILVHGSRTLVHALMAADLVDEYRIMVFPIVVGAGMKLFGDTAAAVKLQLTASKTFPSGTTVLTYVPAR
jgi:dihydrofolate reductase